MCATFSASAADPAQCGTAVFEIAVGDRDQDAAAAALKTFDEALELAQRTPEPDDLALRGRYHHALGRARLARMDAELEPYLQRPPLANLDAFGEWFPARSARADALIKGLAGLKATQDPPSLVGAALRTSWVALHLADQLRTTEIPDSIRTDDDKRALYCDELNGYASRSDLIARAAAEYCTDHAVEADYEGPEVPLCRNLIDTLSDDPAAG